MRNSRISENAKIHMLKGGSSQHLIPLKQALCYKTRPNIRLESSCKNPLSFQRPFIFSIKYNAKENILKGKKKQPCSFLVISSIHNVSWSRMLLTRPICEWFSGLRCFATKRCFLRSFLSHLEYRMAY